MILGLRSLNNRIFCYTWKDTFHRVQCNRLRLKNLTNRESKKRRERGSKKLIRQVCHRLGHRRGAKLCGQKLFAKNVSRTSDEVGCACELSVALAFVLWLLFAFQFHLLRCLYVLACSCFRFCFSISATEGVTTQQRKLKGEQETHETRANATDRVK